MRGNVLDKGECDFKVSSRIDRHTIAQVDEAKIVMRFPVGRIHINTPLKLVSRNIVLFKSVGVESLLPDIVVLDTSGRHQ